MANCFGLCRVKLHCSSILWPELLTRLCDSEERWKSEGIQVGGPCSARGVIGHWFDKCVSFCYHRPCRLPLLLMFALFLTTLAETTTITVLQAQQCSSKPATQSASRTPPMWMTLTSLRMKRMKNLWLQMVTQYLTTMMKMRQQS